jgi:hypothetical protein
LACRAEEGKREGGREKEVRLLLLPLLQLLLLLLLLLLLHYYCYRTNLILTMKVPRSFQVLTTMPFADTHDTAQLLRHAGAVSVPAGHFSNALPLTQHVSKGCAGQSVSHPPLFL